MDAKHTINSDFHSSPKVKIKKEIRNSPHFSERGEGENGMYRPKEQLKCRRLPLYGKNVTGFPNVLQL